MSLIKAVFLALLFFSACLPSLKAESHEQASEQRPAYFCYFLPPKGWDIVDPRTLSPRVQISFFKKKSEGFCPSINLAIEHVDISQSEYLKAVKNIQEADRANRWRHLGKVHTTCGVAELTEIDTQSDWGPVRMLQLILVKHGNAYVLTAAALKKEIPQLYREFQTAFRSLQITEDLISCIPQMERRESLKTVENQLMSCCQSMDAQEAFLDLAFQEKHWIPFQASILKDYEDMGAHWQFLVLKDLQSQLLSIKKTSAPEAESTLEADLSP
ncbi:MAG: hypothetical protein K2P51_07490 [Rhabdochlamydiaceae bacterium]|nr:hypothetical protein [Rhabdochlamydiaceae bacterium]